MANKRITRAKRNSRNSDELVEPQDVPQKRTKSLPSLKTSASKPSNQPDPDATAGSKKKVAEKIDWTATRDNKPGDFTGQLLTLLEENSLYRQIFGFVLLDNTPESRKITGDPAIAHCRRIAVNLFVNHPSGKWNDGDADALATSVKNQIYPLKTTFREHAETMGQTGEGLNGKDDIEPGSELENKWYLSELIKKKFPCWFRMCDLMKGNPSIKPPLVVSAVAAPDTSFLFGTQDETQSDLDHTSDNGDGNTRTLDDVKPGNCTPNQKSKSTASLPTTTPTLSSSRTEKNALHNIVTSMASKQEMRKDIAEEEIAARTRREELKLQRSIELEKLKLENTKTLQESKAKHELEMERIRQEGETQREVACQKAAAEEADQAHQRSMAMFEAMARMLGQGRTGAPAYPAFTPRTATPFAFSSANAAGDLGLGQSGTFPAFGEGNSFDFTFQGNNPRILVQSNLIQKKSLQQLPPFTSSS
ncbi:hypothetical protein BDV93DRAFT_513578 [Ceratobasidium sp. AG-I]|nr:hypothetical protein BDV93DRAFT_513578 [Ceratobasidium sp. AG-I]